MIAYYNINQYQEVFIEDEDHETFAIKENDYNIYLYYSNENFNSIEEAIQECEKDLTKELQELATNEGYIPDNYTLENVLHTLMIAYSCTINDNWVESKED